MYDVGASLIISYAASRVSPQGHMLGQGGQYRGMGAVLYRTIPLFREIVDHCHSLLIESGFPGVLQILCPDQLPMDLSQEEEFEINQSALFVLEYALASVWMSWGIRPAVVIGHR